jgi:hypothetical protein
MHLTHASHHVKMGLDEIFPALARMNIFLFDVQHFTNGEELSGSKHCAIVRNEIVWCPKTFHGCIQDDQHTGQMLPLKNGTGENRSRESVHDGDNIK